VAAVAGGGLDPAPVNRTVPVWDVETGEVTLTLTGHEAEATAVAFSPDGQRLVTGARDGTARLWDAASGEEQHTLLTGAPVFDVAFSPDERFVVAGGDYGTVTVFDAATAERVGILEGHNRNHLVFGLAFVPDGRLVTAGLDGTARVWDVESGNELVVFRGHGAPVNRVAVSPDGTRVATVGDDAAARLWDPTTGQESLSLFGHEPVVYGVAFSPDGRFLATSSTDNTAALYLLPVDEVRELARERVTRGLTDDECRQYLRLAQCPQVDR
jgi:WD40 repeat protein